MAALLAVGFIRCHGSSQAKRGLDRLRENQMHMSDLYADFKHPRRDPVEAQLLKGIDPSWKFPPCGPYDCCYAGGEGKERACVSCNVTRFSDSSSQP